MTRRDWTRIVGITALSRALPAQTLDSPGRFLVKLATDLSTQKNRPGDKVTAFVISPERFLAGIFEGAVSRVSGDSLEFTFESLKFKDKTFRVTSKVVEFVNSKGHKLMDERERPLKVVEGRLQSGPAGFTPPRRW